MEVYYGYSRLTAKAVKQRELAVYFENSNNCKNEEWIKKRMDIYYTRKQTAEEAKDGANSNRMFTKYSYFIDDKKYKSDLDKVLQDNYQADSKNVKTEELENIREALKKGFKKTYNN